MRAAAEGMPMESFSTLGPPGGARVAAWNDVYSSRLAQVEFSPFDRNRFSAALDLGVLGPLRIARMCVDRCSIDRKPSHIGPTAGRHYAFVLQVHGHGLFRQYGRDAALCEGDLTLCDSSAPHSMRVEEASEFIMLRVPADVLRRHLPSPERFCGSLLSAAEGYAHSATSLATSLLRQVDVKLSVDHQNRIARSVLDMMATSYAIAFDGSEPVSSILSARQADVKRYIEDNLRDPELSPSSVQAALKISSRYLRMIFAADSNETVSAYILRRRLEECARQLGDLRWGGHTITEIAFSWGFNSAPHFTRSFRDCFNTSPREYRRSYLESLGTSVSALALPAC
jgi:AraC family transcriptional activator of tynA and feaB